MENKSDKNKKKHQPYEEKALLKYDTESKAESISLLDGKYNSTYSDKKINQTQNDYENKTFRTTVENDLGASLIPQTKTLNPDYSAFMFYFYMLLYCIPGFYYGSQLSIMTNLGKPIIRRGLNITDEDKMGSLLGVINLCFGMGKLTASILAGSIAKQIGKHNVLYIGLLTNIASCVLAYFPNE